MSGSKSKSNNIFDDKVESSDNLSITEEKMVDIAEKILSVLANLLINNGWSVEEVFG